jgi:hypothetical protein
VEREELLICAFGVAGTLADYVTTQIGLRMGLAEANPLVNPVLEGAFAVGGPILVSEVGKRLQVSRSLRHSLMLMPASIPMIVAIRNLMLIGTVNARKYAISEFPLIYW